MKRIVAIILAAWLFTACPAMAETPKPAESTKPQVTEEQLDAALQTLNDMKQLRGYQYKEIVKKIEEVKAMRAQLQKQEPKK